MRLLICLFLSCVLIPSCKKEEANEAIYPQRPKDHPQFLNTSKIERIEDVAIGELRRAKKLTGIDFTMVLLPSLPSGYTAESYAAELFSQWKIGDDTKGRGVLFLFLENQGVLKTEVSYELEGIFPDAFVGSFQDSLRHYYAGEYFGDVVCGMITAMVKRAQNDQSQEILTEFNSSFPSPPSQTSTYSSGGAGVIKSGFFYDQENKFKLIRQLDEKTRRKYAAASDPDVVLRRYVKSLSLGYNDPNLDLLTEGSKYMRLEYPKSAGFQRQAARNFGGEYSLKIQGDLAAAQFSKGGVMPLLLRRYSDGLWRIDVTKSWAYYQTTSDFKTTIPIYDNNPWMFAWPSEVRKKASRSLPKLLTPDQSVANEIAKLEKKINSGAASASTYFQLSDIFYFECYWIRAAMNAVEKGLLLEPTNTPYRKRLIDMSYRFPDLTDIPRHYDAILELDPVDKKTIRNYIWFLETYRKDPKKIAELKEMQKNPPFPKAPVLLSAGPAKQHYASYYIPRELREVSLDITPLQQDWHTKWYPTIRVVLIDSTKRKIYGLQIDYRQENGKGIVGTISLTTGFKSLDIPSRSLPGAKVINGKKSNLKFQWNESGSVALELNGKDVGNMTIDFVPDRVLMHTRSGKVRLVVQPAK